MIEEFSFSDWLSKSLSSYSQVSATPGLTLRWTTWAWDRFQQTEWSQSRHSSSKSWTFIVYDKTTRPHCDTLLERVRKNIHFTGNCIFVQSVQKSFFHLVETDYLKLLMLMLFCLCEDHDSQSKYSDKKRQRVLW